MVTQLNHQKASSLFNIEKIGYFNVYWLCIGYVCVSVCISLYYYIDIFNIISFNLYIEHIIQLK